MRTINFKSWLHVTVIFSLILLSAISARATEQPQAQRAKSSGPARAETAQTNNSQPVSNGLVVLNVADIAERANKVVVNIQSATEEGGTSFGSGFIIDEHGILATNFHVIREAVKSGSPITVTTDDGTSYTASVKGFDESTD